ncbi:MAG: MCE family protein [Zoogloeaceae bacterium]|nr:MCE family protein [Zoogloeaceae bacterium]
MENKAHAFAAGVFALLLMLATLAAIWWFGDKRDSVSEYLVVTRQNVTGLNLQGQVRYRGIRVGRVESIRLDPDDSRNILVRISIEQAVPVTRRTIAKLGYQGVTGIAYVLLEEAEDDSEALDAGKGMPRIPMRPSFLQEFSEAGSDVLDQAQALLANLNDLLTPANKARIGKTLANLEAGSAGLTATLAEVKALLADPRVQRLGPAIANIEGAAGEAKVLLRDVATLVPRMTALIERVDQMVGEANGEGLAASATRLQELGSELTRTARQLTHTLQLIEEAPQSLFFGPPVIPPGPGEPGFVSAGAVKQ